MLESSLGDSWVQGEPPSMFVVPVNASSFTACNPVWLKAGTSGVPDVTVFNSEADSEWASGKGE